MRPRRPQRDNFPLVLTQGLSEEETKEYETAWRNSTYVSDPIKQHLLTRLESLELDSDEDYNIPNWQLLRADKNGRIKEILNLLKLLP